jgi:hypothetical protein
MTAIALPLQYALGQPYIKSFPKVQYEKIKELVDRLNSITTADGVISLASITTSGAISATGKVTATGGISTATANVVEFTKEVSLSAANLIAMYTTPVELVAAPASGYALDFVSAVLIYDSTATAFTSGGAITINYGSGGAAVSTTLAATFLTGAGDKVWNLQKLNAAGGYTMPVGTSLVITNATGVFATGTGVCRMQITYRVITTGL